MPNRMIRVHRTPVGIVLPTGVFLCEYVSRKKYM